MASPRNLVDSDDLVLIFVVVGCLYLSAALGACFICLFLSKRRRRIENATLYDPACHRIAFQKSLSSSLLTPIETISAHVSTNGNNFEESDVKWSSQRVIDRHRSAVEIAVLNIEAMHYDVPKFSQTRWHSTQV